MLTGDFIVEEKDGCENLVTSSDIAVQEFLIRELSALLPGCGFICEEEGVNDPDKDYVWVIDPIDGTANYARGTENCAISVGLRHQGGIILGVVYSPGRGEMYSAEKGCGAFCNDKPIHTSSRPFHKGLLFTALSTYRKEFAQVCADILVDTFHQCNDMRRYGSAAVELCLLASGESELYFEIRLQPWDYAAGICILREAGGCISSLHGRELRFDGPDLVCAANNAENHSRLLDIIGKHLPEIPYTD